MPSGLWAGAVDTRPLLPNEPRIADWPREAALTDRYLRGAESALETLLLTVRAELDPKLCAQQPTKLGKPYPLGQCLEISQAVQTHLDQLHPHTLNADARVGYDALAAFLAAGGSARQVWGDLRGQYFQNAYLIGTLYVDVSNDTVVPTKPKVEILPFGEANFRPITDYSHFARIAKNYWRAEVMPNHLLPTLAPYLPALTAIPDSGVRLGMPTNYMVALTTRSQFQVSQDFLAQPAMTNALFDLLKGKLVDLELPVAASLAQGRVEALNYCQQYRAAGYHCDQTLPAEIVLAMRAVNGCLSTLCVHARADA